MRSGSFPRLRFLAPVVAALVFVRAAALVAQDVPRRDRLRDLQERQVATKDEKIARPDHFGSQGPGNVFSNHTSHSNRLIPIYVFGRKADLGAITGKNSRYRTEAGVRAVFGRVPEHTVNPEAEYADQSDLYRLQKDAVAHGVKHLFIVWFDGMDWDTTRAAAVARSGHDYEEGPGSGLLFQDYPGAGPVQFGSFVTSPTRDAPKEGQLDVNTQTVADLSHLLGGGYDVALRRPQSLDPGAPRRAAGYFKGQSASPSEKAAVAAAGGVLHAYTDSSCSAGEFASGVKSYNNGLNVTDDGRFVPTLFNQLQAQGWKVGTVTSVPFDHASPAGMYAHNVYRDDYQDIGREMLGLRSIVQDMGKSPRLPGLDVVIGTGWGATIKEDDLRKQQGQNAVPGNPYITNADLNAIADRYEIAQRTAGVAGPKSLQDAAEQAARTHRRLFGFYGVAAGHLPYCTADGRYDPPKGIKGVAERYQPADLTENPTLANMSQAALTVLAAEPLPVFRAVRRGGRCGLCPP